MSSKPGSVFPPLQAAGKREKPLDSSGFPAFQSAVRRSEPLGATPARSAVAIPVPAAIVAVHAAMAPIALTEAISHVGENGKAALLAVVEGPVERVRRIGEFLHGCCGGRHVLGALAQAGHRIVRLLLVAVALRGHPRLGAGDPQP